MTASESGPSSKREIFCATEPENRLGDMGVPIKVTLKDKEGKDQDVFICCKGCEKKALANPDQTLAKVTELKAQVIANSAAKTKDK